MTKCETCDGCETCDEAPSVKEIAECIANKYPQLNCFLIDGHDSAIVGIAINKDDLAENAFRAVYDTDQIIENCMEWAADYDEAAEYCDFNIFSAHFGPGTPLYVHDDITGE